VLETSSRDLITILKDHPGQGVDLVLVGQVVSLLLVAAVEVAVEVRLHDGNHRSRIRIEYFQGARRVL
jgi:hypothetical protein